MQDVLVVYAGLVCTEITVSDNEIDVTKMDALIGRVFGFFLEQASSMKLPLFLKPTWSILSF